MEQARVSDLLPPAGRSGREGCRVNSELFLSKSVSPVLCGTCLYAKTIFVDLKFTFNRVPCTFIFEVRPPDPKVILRKSGVAVPAATGQVL